MHTIFAGCNSLLHRCIAYRIASPHRSSPLLPAVCSCAAVSPPAAHVNVAPHLSRLNCGPASPRRPLAGSPRRTSSPPPAFLVPSKISSRAGSMDRTRARTSQRMSSRRTLGAQFSRPAQTQTEQIRSRNSVGNGPARLTQNSVASLPVEARSLHRQRASNFRRRGNRACFPSSPPRTGRKVPRSPCHRY